MASINKVMIIGNLGRDPEVSQKGDMTIANLAVATSRKSRSKDGQVIEETEWHRVVLFGRSAELARDYLKKGRSIFIEGRLRTKKYQAKDGTEKSVTEIVGENMQFIASGRQDDQQPAQRPAPGPAPAARQQRPPQRSSGYDDYPF